MNSWSEHVRDWLELARLAPSAHNTQPWWCKITQNGIDLHNDPDHTLHSGDPTLRETILGLGTFLENLRLAAAYDHFQMIIKQSAFKTGENKPWAKLEFQENYIPNQEENILWKAVPDRHTNRGLYQENPLDSATLEYLQNIQLEPGITAHFIVEEEAKARIADLVAKGIKIGLSLPPIKNELAELVSFKSEERTSGMLVEAMAQKPGQSENAKDWILNKLDVAQEAQFNHQKFATAPLIVVLTSDLEGPQTWLKAGQTLERILLAATSKGLNHCISAGPVEIPTLTPLVRQEVGNAGRPQALFRLGIPVSPDFTISSPRRSVEEILKD